MLQDPNSNPYGLGDGVKYYMLEVEDWTQPTQLNKRKAGPRKSPADKGSKEPVVATTTLTPGSPQADVEDSFHVTPPRTSHLFPVRSRSNSTPTAGPSSLSRLLAQAATENPLDTVVPARTPSPMASPPPPPSPTRTPHHAPGVPSPLRPGSRASRVSSSSRFSVGRIPPLGSSSSGSTGMAKAAPTTALSERLLPSSVSSAEDNRPASPLVGEYALEVASSRRRTTSYHAPRTSGLSAAAGQVGDGVGLTASSTLASLANSWGVSFRRKRKPEHGSLATAVESPSDASGSAEHTMEPSAKDLLKRF
jgi:autophagy-related protein 11